MKIKFQIYVFIDLSTFRQLFFLLIPVMRLRQFYCRHIEWRKNSSFPTVVLVECFFLLILRRISTTTPNCQVSSPLFFSCTEINRVTQNQGNFCQRVYILFINIQRIIVCFDCDAKQILCGSGLLFFSRRKSLILNFPESIYAQQRSSYTFFSLQTKTLEYIAIFGK